jgi:uncharacterized membrane protein YfcA
VLELVLSGATAVMAGVISGYASFGGGLLLVPPLVWLVTPVDAAVMAAAALLLITGWRYCGPRGTVPSFITGALAGGVTGAFGILGTPFNATYFLSAAIEQVHQRANIVTSNAALATAFLLGLVAAAVINEALLWKTALVVSLLDYCIAVWKHLFDIAPVSWFRKVTLGLLLATGLSALLL